MSDPKKFTENLEEYAVAFTDAAKRRNQPIHKSVVKAKLAMATQLYDAIGKYASSTLLMDSRDTLYMQHMVMQILSGIERHEYPDVKWANGDLVPITSEVDELTDFFGWHEVIDMVDKAGQRKLLLDDEEDVPFVNIKGRFNQGRTFGWGRGFHFTEREVRQQQKGMVNVVDERSRICREAIDRDLNNLVATGESRMGVAGIFNLPDTQVQLTTASGKKHDGTSGAASPSEIISDWKAIYPLFNQVEEPDTVVMPRLVYAHYSMTNMDATYHANDKSVLEWLKMMWPFIKKWEWTDENDSSGQGGAPCTLIYRKDPERVRFEVPLRPAPSGGPERRGSKTLVTLRGRYATPIVKRPKSVLQWLGVGNGS